MIHIHASDPDLDENLLLHLWAAALGSQWPMDGAWLRSVSRSSTYLPGDCLVATVDGHPAGFALTQIGKGSEPRGSILAVGVQPEFRRQGIGRLLHETAVQRLGERGAKQIQLGAGAGEYFWPGVPLGLPEAWPFFQPMGWPEIERSFDLVRSLEDYRTPAWVWERLSGLGIEFMTAERLPAEKVLAFVAAEEGGWKDIYTRFFEADRARDVLLAIRRVDGEIAGACWMDSDSRRWAGRFSCPLGAPGCILTGKKWRGQGIGTALVARANEILQARGCKTSFIGWTWLVDWYGKLGYGVWQEYRMSWRTLRA
jgi:GNAT superfamily N-acetyltransferase